jgi:hypothetical protein
MSQRVHYARTWAKSQPVKKFPAFYGTRGFITASTRNRHACSICPFLYELHLSNHLGVRYILRNFDRAMAHDVSGRPFTRKACFRSQPSKFVYIMVANWLFSLRILQFFPARIIPRMLHTHISFIFIISSLCLYLNELILFPSLDQICL